MTKKKAPEDYLPIGRPTLYRPEYCQELIECFDIEPYREITRVHQRTGNEYTERIANILPSLVGFAAKIGVSRMTIQNWGKKYPDFLYAVTCAKACAEHILVTNALLGLYNAQFSIFVAKNYTDLRDVQEVKELTDEEPLQTPEELCGRIAELDEEIAYLEAQI